MQLFVPGVDEAMSGCGGSDDDVSSCRGEPGTVELELGPACVDDEQLGIRVAVELRACTRPIVDQEQ